MVLIVYVPILQKVFQTTGLGWRQWAVLALFAPIMLISDELRKMFFAQGFRGHRHGRAKMKFVILGCGRVGIRSGDRPPCRRA